MITVIGGGVSGGGATLSSTCFGYRISVGTIRGQNGQMKGKFGVGRPRQSKGWLYKHLCHW